MRSIVLLLLSLICVQNLLAQSNFATAVPLNADTRGSGTVSSSVRYYYFKIGMPADGTLNIFVDGTHKSGTAGSFDLYVYDKGNREIGSKRQLGGKNISTGQELSDTLKVYSRTADSIYLLLYQGASPTFDFTISYSVTDKYPMDVEPNNTWAQANPIASGQTKQGLIGYTQNASIDRYDYYKTLLPASGTVKVLVEGIHTGGGSSSFDFYAYDKGHRQIYVKRQLGNKNHTYGERFKDTLLIYSRSVDSIYLLTYQGNNASFAYTISYEMIDQQPEDPEPNDQFQDATPVALDQTHYGRLGNVTNGVADRYDYYQVVMPADGTLNFQVEATHSGGAAGSFDLFVLDKAQRQIGVKRQLGNKNHTLNDSFRDSLLVYSRARDTMYFLIYTAGNSSFNYAVSVGVEDQSAEDEEPNDQTTNAASLNYQEVKPGHLGYVANAATDRYDYYQIIMPADGTLTVFVKGQHTGGAAGSFDLYVLDRGQRQIGVKRQLGNNPHNLYDRFSDSLKVYSREQDTLYLLAYQANNISFAYEISYEVQDQSEQDPEPNGEFRNAIFLEHNQTKSGHIGYTANAVTDRYDYYKAVLPVDGTVKVYLEGTHTGGAAGSFDLYVYDRSQRQIVVKRGIGNKAFEFGQSFKDTVEIASRAADTLYFLVYQGANLSHSYKIRFLMPDALQGDPEPNNSFNEAAPVQLTDTIAGLLGYVSNAVTDRNDYFKLAVPEKSTVTIYLEATHTGGTEGSFGVYGYDKNQRTLFSKAAVGRAVREGELLRDTLEIKCNNTDSLYLLIYQGANRSFSYTVRMKATDNKPVAAFSYTRTGNEFGFVNKSRNTDAVNWRLGNNQTSTVNYPMQELNPGFYTIRLIATNSTCNFRDTATQEITVSGIESFTPGESGIGGDLLMTIYGGGLVENTKVALSGNGGTLEAKEVLPHAKGTKLGVLFDLHFANPGTYDLTVTFPNKEPIVYEKAFTINAMVYPETWSEIAGPAVWRTGREANFNLVVGNNGNTMARGAIVALAWPKDVTIEFIGKEHRPDPNGFREIIMDDGEVIRSKNEVVQWIYDANTVRPIDTFGLEPYDGYIKYFTVPMVPAGSTVDIPFRASSSGSGMHQLKTYTVKPNQFGSCETYNIGTALTGPAAVELYINTLDVLVDEVKAPPATKIPAQVAVKSLKVTQKHIDNSSKIASHRFWAWYYGADDLTESEYYDYYKEGLAADEFAIAQVKDIAFDKAVDYGAAGLAKRSEYLTNQLDAANKSMLHHSDKSKEYMSRSRRRQNKNRREALEALSADEALKFEEALASGQMTIDQLRKMEFIEKSVKFGKDAKTVKGQIEAMIKYIEENCPDHKEQLEALKELLGKEKDIINPKDKDTETRTSYDPNAIYGPNGFGAARYINKTERQPFVIMFENVDTAKADAQIVQILDTLDRTKFDLSSFEFGNVSIGKKIFRVPNGRKEFMMERSLAPERNMRVRINASLDTATGVVQWQFTSIDPATGDLPDFDGFLPPNKDYPSGEGSVAYTINPVKGLVNGTEMLSRASIIFDTNDPIQTNTWKNIIDALEPRGQIRAQILQDSMIVLNYSAVDAGSGVDYYHLYMSEDGGEWLPIPGGHSDSLILFGDPGKTYRFHMEALDKTGNREKKTVVGEVQVIMPAENDPQPLANWRVYPVPTTGEINLELDINEPQQLVVQVYSATGQRVAELYNGSAARGLLKLTRSLQHLSTGLYFIQVRGSRGLDLKKKVLLTK